MITTQAVGRLTKDPDADTTSKGKPVTTLRIACGGHREDETPDYLTVKVYGDTRAAPAYEHLRKGQQVTIFGRLRHHEWTDQNGQLQSTYHLIANQIEFGQRARTTEQQPDPIPVG